MYKSRCNILIILLLLYLIPFSRYSLAQEILRLAITTTTDNTGIADKLNRTFEARFGVKVHVIAAGTGEALRHARDGDVDLVFVHEPVAEMEFVESGYGIERTAVMHNYFVILGPGDDPANIKTAKSPSDALLRIADSRSTFISRGDESGTHIKEKNLWEMVKNRPEGRWYLSAGQGMGMVLIMANDKQAYTISDRGTYLAYKDKISLEILFEDDEILYNPYHIIIVNPEKHSHANATLAKKYVDFITSKEGQDIIGNFRINGKILFYPDVFPIE